MNDQQTTYKLRNKVFAVPLNSITKVFVLTYYQYTYCSIRHWTDLLLHSSPSSSSYSKGPNGLHESCCIISVFKLWSVMFSIKWQRSDGNFLVISNTRSFFLSDDFACEVEQTSEGVKFSSLSSVTPWLDSGQIEELTKYFSMWPQKDHLRLQRCYWTWGLHYCHHYLSFEKMLTCNLYLITNSRFFSFFRLSSVPQICNFAFQPMEDILFWVLYLESK